MLYQFTVTLFLYKNTVSIGQKQPLSIGRFQPNFVGYFRFLYVIFFVIFLF